jgi:hypothetical protein
MSAKKRFFWLKLKSDFFNQREVKKLIKDEGKLYFEGTENNIAKER